MDISEKLQIVVVVPAYNEEKYIEQMLKSIVGQDYLPKQLIVVDDGSTDNTGQIVADFSRKYSFIKGVKNHSESKHLPGSKVIRAFNRGVEEITETFDIIIKLDADIVLPSNYLKEIEEQFRKDSKVGMVGGFAYIYKNQEWILEKLTNDDHIRGAFKAYRKDCFEQIGGLKPAMGWDTVDELLCRYYGWKIVTCKHLKVKHLKPTGKTYTSEAKFKQGEAFYSMGYNWSLLLIASLKLAYNKRNLRLVFNDIRGYYRAKKSKKQRLVTDEQAAFIQKFRWGKIKQKLGLRA